MTTNSFNAQEFENRIIDKAQADATYKQRLLSNPRAVFEEEIGQKLPADVEIQVLQQSIKKLYLLLPLQLDELARSQALSEEQLEAVAGGGISKAVGIGVAAVLSLSVLGGGGSTPS
ncbi:MAG: NHLP leader peptide family RiPP precursor [Nostoc sp.]